MTPAERKAVADLARKYEELESDPTYSIPTRKFFGRQRRECLTTLASDGYNLVNNTLRRIRGGTTQKG